MKNKQKWANSDFKYESLPHNRVELFFDVIKINWRKVLLLGLLILLAFLPFIAVAFFRDNYGVHLTNMVENGELSVEDRLYSLKLVHLIASLVQWATLYVVFILMGGIARIMRNLVWSDPVFFKEDFAKGVKDNIKFGLITATILGLMLVVNKASLFISDNFVVQIIPMAIFLAVVLPPVFLTYTQSTIYKGKYKELLRNSVLMFIKDAPRFLFFTFIVVSPFYLTFIDSNFMVKYILVVVFTFLSSFLLEMYYLFSNYIFDKYINITLSPSLYKKGLYNPLKEFEKVKKEKKQNEKI